MLHRGASIVLTVALLYDASPYARTKSGLRGASIVARLLLRGASSWRVPLVAGRDSPWHVQRSVYSAY